MNIKQKLASRKFWICVAAFLASIGASIAGIQTSSDIVAAIGTVCAVISAAIYAAAEASVDASAVAKYKNKTSDQPMYRHKGYTNRKSAASGTKRIEKPLYNKLTKKGRERWSGYSSR